MKTKTGLISQRASIRIFGCFSTAIFMACCFLNSCNNKEDLLNPASKDAATLTSKSLKNGADIKVSPSGNYTDDSYNIQTALDNAVAAGQGSTVQLTKGTFYLNKSIEIEGFEGFFKGAGKEKTIITTYGKVNFDNLVGGDMPALIKFRHGNIHVSDMTIMISDPEPTNMGDWSNGLPSVFTITGNSSVDPILADQAVSSVFDNVKFVGGAGNIGIYNVFEFINVSSDVWPLYSLNGGLKITNCEFKTGYYCIFNEFNNGPCIIGGAEFSGNKFEDSELAVGIQDLDNSYCNISYNHITKIYWTAIYLWQGAEISSLSLSKYLVYRNDIEVNSLNQGDWTTAIWLVDDGIFKGDYTVTKMDMTVSNNNLFLNNIGAAGILGECPSNVVVTNNKIWGSAFAGIACGIFDNAPIGWEATSGWLIKGNNVKGLNLLLSPPWWTPQFTVAPIWLGQGTSNFVVYADKNDVLDEGTNNIVIGDHNKRNGHSSHLEINEEMMRRHAMVKWHNHPRMK
jgi:hypothetical protein